MIKGIVSGVEKDITRIPMKGKNLFDKDNDTVYNAYFNDVGAWLLNDGSRCVKIPCSPSTTYSLSISDATQIFRIYESSDTEAEPTQRADVYLRKVVRSSDISRYTFTTSQNAKFLVFQGSFSDFDSWMGSLMLNEGSAPLPYEPYGYQEGWEVRKGDGTLIWGRSDTISVNSGTMPIKGYGVPLVSVTPEGNSEQNGTPTPTNPIDVTGTGERTTQLFDKSAVLSGYYVSDVTGEIGTGASYSDTNASDWIYVSGLSSVYIEHGSATGRRQWGAFYNGSKQFISGISGYNKSLSVPATAVYMRLTVVDEYLDTLMLNLGSTPLPYEPYGWKVPLTIRGENLFSISLPKTDYAANVYMWTIVGLKPNTSYTCSSNFVQSGTSASIWFGGTSSGTNGVSQNNPKTMTTNANGEVTMYINHNSGNAYDQIQNGDTWVMLNEGSAALPYAPYHSTTTPIYLGQTPSVRRVKKLVLTGEEVDVNKRTSPENSYSISIDRNNWPAPATGYGLSSHFVRNGTVSDLSSCEFYVGMTAFSFRIDSCTDATSFRQFLRDEYAAGTPVTVWYVLSSPETGVVNEPLMKIGSYADTVTVTDQDVTITPAVGNDVLTVDTTLPPSKLTAVGHVRERST